VFPVERVAARSGRSAKSRLDSNDERVPLSSCLSNGTLATFGDDSLREGVEERAMTATRTTTTPPV
jgi:hypothetical protein